MSHTDQMIHQADRIVSRVTPVLITIVLIITILSLVFTLRTLSQQTQRGEERTEQLVELLIEGRDEWRPALDRLTESTVRIERHLGIEED